MNTCQHDAFNDDSKTATFVISNLSQCPSSHSTLYIETRRMINPIHTYGPYPIDTHTTAAPATLPIMKPKMAPAPVPKIRHA